MLNTTLHRHSLGSCTRRNRPAHAQQQRPPCHAQSSPRLASAPLNTAPATSYCTQLATRRQLGAPARAAASTTASSSSSTSNSSSSSMAVAQGSNGASSGALAAAFSRLQNGSDIRGVAMARTPEENITLTPAAATCIAASFAAWLRKQQQETTTTTSSSSSSSSKEDPTRGDKKLVVALGSDPRLTGPLLRAAIVAGLQSEGVEVRDAGLCTTPAMFYALVALGSDVDGSIMLTASHMPSQNNGMKFFTRRGGLDKGDIKQLLEGAATRGSAAGLRLGDPLSDTTYVINTALAAARKGGYAQVPLLAEYAASLRNKIIEGVNHPQHRDTPLKGLKIVVDAGNGSGGFFADQVLAPLGADTKGSRFLDPDGSFPNHIPNPEAKEAMDSAVEAVKEAGADLGIVFDTDVDRSAIVDAGGAPINSNRFIALMAAIVLADHPGTTIVTDSVTSNGLTAFIEGMGGKHFRWKRGYKNVISKGQELAAQGKPAALMMETSGHGALADNNYLDDGAALAVLAVIQMVRLKVAGKGGLGELLASLQEPAEAAEYRIRIQGSDFKQTGTSILAAFDTWVTEGAGGAPGWSKEPVNHEGVRVNIDQGQREGGQTPAAGWALLRASLHDPLLVLNIESDVAGGEASIRGTIAGWLKQHYGEQLDLARLG